MRLDAVCHFWHASEDMPKRTVVWVGSSREDLGAFPEAVRVAFGSALHVAQLGGRHPSAKPLTGYRGAGVLELIDDFAGDAYRAVYTLRFADVISVRHASKKKSRHGIFTPREDARLIEKRLTDAERLHAERNNS